MAYQIRFLTDASRTLERLDTSVARKISDKLRWLSENIADVQHKGLRGQLAGYSKLRVGGWRIIYKTFPKERIIVVRYIEHRSKIYGNE